MVASIDRPLSPLQSLQMRRPPPQTPNEPSSSPDETDETDASSPTHALLGVALVCISTTRAAVVTSPLALI